MNYRDFGVTCAEELEQDEWSLSRPTFETPKGSVLTVLGWKGRGRSNKRYIIKCSACSMDRELFGDGVFGSSKRHLTKGVVPCGCSLVPRWKEEQQVLRITRQVEKEGYNFAGWVGEFKGNITKCRLICPDHGQWESTNLASALRGVGCPLCSSNVPLTRERFIEKSLEAHGDKYDYGLVKEPFNNRSKVEIVCPKHGSFSQQISNHLMGQGCPSCGGSKKLTTRRFIMRSEERYGKGFDYSMVEYVNSLTPVTITCPKHGVFKVTPKDHLVGKSLGCEGCSREKLSKKFSMGQNVFIQRAREKHGNTYNYDLVDYRNARSKVKIKCKLHGVFLQSPSQHLLGQGCPWCSGRMQRQAYLHIVQENDIAVALKFGISKDWHQRIVHLNSINLFQSKILGVWEFVSPEVCRSAEDDCKQSLRTGILSSREMRSGWTETVSVLDLEKVIAIYEKHGGKRIK